MAKSGKNSGELRTPRHGGGKIRAGSKPGNTPGTGRPPDEFKRICQHLTTRAQTLSAVTTILDDPAHPAYLGALKWASEHGYGKPSQSVDVTSGGKRITAFTMALGTLREADDVDG